MKTEIKELTLKTEIKELTLKTEIKELTLKTEIKELTLKTEIKELTLKTEIKELTLKTEFIIILIINFKHKMTEKDHLSYMRTIKYMNLSSNKLHLDTIVNYKGLKLLPWQVYDNIYRDCLLQISTIPQQNTENMKLIDKIDVRINGQIQWFYVHLLRKKNYEGLKFNPLLLFKNLKSVRKTEFIIKIIVNFNQNVFYTF